MGGWTAIWLLLEGNNFNAEGNSTDWNNAAELVARLQVPSAERVVGRNIMYWHKVWFVPEPTREGLDGLASLGETKIFLRSQATEQQDFPPRTMVSGGRPSVDVDYGCLCWVSWCRAVSGSGGAILALDCFLAVREADRRNQRARLGSSAESAKLVGSIRLKIN